MKTMMKINQGVTLLELLIVMAIAGILTVLAAPSFNTMIANNKTSSSRDQLFHDIAFTRSHALSEALTVTICSANNDASDCAASATWNNGWIIFTDTDGDSTVDSGDGDSILKIHPPLDSQLTSTGVTDLTYGRQGYLAGATGGTFTFCHSDYETEKQVIVNGIGRPSMDEGSC